MHIFPSFITAKSLGEALKLYEDIFFDNDPVIRCDGSHLRFADPAGICLLAIAARKATENAQSVEIENLPQHQHNYLDRMDVFADCAVRVMGPPCQRNDRRNVLAAVARLANARQTDIASVRLAHAMLGDVDPDDFVEEGDMHAGAQAFQHQALAYVLSELLENGLTHAKKHGNAGTCAWVACQYYKSNGKLRAAVIDDGCGYYESLRHRYSTQIAQDHDISAIRLALEPKISSNREVGIQDEAVNEGMGLTICRDIVLAAGGTFGVASGDDHFRTGPGGEFHEQIPQWKGALVHMEMPRQGLREVRIAEILARYAEEPHQDVRFED